MVNRLKDFFSLKDVFTTRSVVFMGVMLGVAVALNQLFTWEVLPGLRVNFSYVPGAAVAALFGPWAALAYGLAADTLKYIAKPNVGGFGYFPGYALSEMATHFIYAVFLFRRGGRRLPLRIAAPAAQLCVLVFVTMGLNLLWRVVLQGGAGAFFAAGAMIVRAISFPVLSALVGIVTRLAREYGIPGKR